MSHNCWTVSFSLNPCRKCVKQLTSDVHLTNGPNGSREQILAGMSAVFVFLFYGLAEAHSSVLLPQLKQSPRTIPVTPEEETWIASFGILMGPVASVLSGPFFDAYGRKKGLQAFYFFAGLGFAIIAFAQEVYQIYVGRILCGIAIGLLPCSVVYLTEISTPQQREVFFSITNTALTIGAMVMSIVGGYLLWCLASLIFSIAAFVFFIVEFFVPESPAWLYKMGKEDSAIHSLQKLGRNDTQIKQELDAYKIQCRDGQEKLAWTTFLKPTVWKPFVIMTSLMFLQSGSGVYDLFFYLVDFVERLDTKYDPLAVAAMLSTVRVVYNCTVVVTFRRKVGRKISVASSGLGMAAAFASAGVYEYVFRDVPTSGRPYQWLPVAALVVYLTTSALGLYGLLALICGELFPLRIRSTMTNVTVGVGYSFGFVSVKLYLIFINALQFYALLFIFAAFAFLAGMFGIFVLPETQNKSLLEIEQVFLPKNERTNAPVKGVLEHVTAM